MKQFVIVDRLTGKPVAEVFAHRLRREGAHAAHYEIITAGEWLARYNGLVRAAGGVEPTGADFLGAVA